MTPKFKSIDKDLVRTLYFKGLSTTQISEQIGGISKSTIRLTLIRDNVKLRTVSEAKKGRKNPLIAGENHPNWRGDKCQPNNGRQRARHLYQAPKGFEIHHKDGNPLNNTPENIAIVTHEQHTVMDGRKAKWSEWRKLGGPRTEASKQKLRDFAKTRPKIHGKFTVLTHLEKPKAKPVQQELGEIIREGIKEAQAQEELQEQLNGFNHSRGL